MADRFLFFQFLTILFLSPPSMEQKFISAFQKITSFIADLSLAHGHLPCDPEQFSSL